MKIDSEKAVLQKIYDKIIDHDKKFQFLLEPLHPNFKESVSNLTHYLVLRTFDLRKIQHNLSEIGLSSLGSPESYAFKNIANNLKIINLLQGKLWEAKKLKYAPGYKRSKKLIKHNNQILFGHVQSGRPMHIMVTLPTEAATNFEMIDDLLLSGMSIARINCGHDDQTVWKAMVENIRRGIIKTQLKCKIYFDLAGPKIRTERLYHRLLEKRKQNWFRLIEGEIIMVCKESYCSRPEFNAYLEYHTVSVSLPQIVDDVLPGQQIWFDDGKIGGKILETFEDYFLVEITKAGIKASKLYPEKGLNLPDTSLSLPSLTEEDLANMVFIAEYADILGYSFVRKPEDVLQLGKILKKLNRDDIGLVLKIENKEAFNNLPLLLMAAMQGNKVGVMIARGDLAVEMGFERISEVQEEILWICESAHVPVIWATQVLENMVKTGFASRAEITDASMSSRAECVMMNKGPYILQALKALNDILSRMKTHQSKKKSTMRKLKIAAFVLKKMKLSLQTTL